jgi:hypothetical protein
MAGRSCRYIYVQIYQAVRLHFVSRVYNEACQTNLISVLLGTMKLNLNLSYFLPNGALHTQKIMLLEVDIIKIHNFY